MRRAVLLVLAAALSACVTAERGRQMEDRLDKLESDSEALSKRSDAQEQLVRDRVATVDKKIVEVQKKIDELNQSARRSGADLGVSLTRLQDEFTRAKGDLEVAQHRLDELQKSLDALDARTDKRFAALKGRGALDQVQAKELIDALPRQDDRSAFLALGQKQEASGNEGVAREIYGEYLRRWPGDPSAPEAAFRAGEIAANQGRPREALVSYGWIYEKAPRSERVPEAMLGMADAMLQLDELKKDAPTVLKELVGKYPKSPAAAKAKAKLAELAPTGEKKKPLKKK
ncbi:MAG TPA: tetratricopeptide repeat protein [Anaeromyxobacter sp.]|nr:tetratricopeptide repeat protein [Anaeromyxobacter sp.]